MKRILGLSLLLVLLSVSCSQEKGTLRISISPFYGEYELRMRGKEGYLSCFTSDKNEIVLSSLEEGIYDLEVSFYSSGDCYHKYEGTLKIRHGINEVAIEAEKEEGMMELTVITDESLSGNLISIYATDEKGNKSEDESIIAEDGKAYFFLSGLEEGRISITIESGSIKENSVINYKANVQAYKIELDVKNVDYTLDLTDLSSPPLSATIRIEEREMIEENLKLYLDFIPFVPPDDIHIFWYADGSFIGEGQSIELKGNGNVKRIDALYHSDSPGSMGSTALVFQ